MLIAAKKDFRRNDKAPHNRWRHGLRWLRLIQSSFESIEIRSLEYL